jgi:hypothetical protein
VVASQARTLRVFAVEETTSEGLSSTSARPEQQEELLPPENHQAKKNIAWQ